MAILDPADFDAVRKALDTDLTADGLPDDTILLDVFLGRAEREVEARIGVGYDDLGAADQIWARSAAVFLTAAYIAPVLPLFDTVNIDGANVKVGRLPPAQLAAHLHAAALSELAKVSVAISATSAPFFFTVAQGQRGR